MCSPFIALASVAAGANAAGAYQQAATQKAMAEYQAKVSANNATMAENQARDAKTRGDLEAFSALRKAEQLKGSQKTALAASGLDISSGTPMDLLESTEIMGEVDANTIRSNAAREAWGYTVEAQNYRNSAAMSRATAKATKPWQSAGLSLLGSAAQSGASYWLAKG